MLVNCKVLFKCKAFLSLFFREGGKHRTERMGCDFLHHGITGLSETSFVILMRSREMNDF